MKEDGADKLARWRADRRLSSFPERVLAAWLKEKTGCTKDMAEEVLRELPEGAGIGELLRSVEMRAARAPRRFDRM